MRGNDGVTIGGNSIFIQLPFIDFLEPASGSPAMLNRKSAENHLCSSDGKSSKQNFKRLGRVHFGNGHGDSTGGLKDHVTKETAWDLGTFV